VRATLRVNPPTRILLAGRFGFSAVLFRHTKRSVGVRDQALFCDDGDAAANANRPFRPLHSRDRL
jgi:hypothetical protein